MAPKGDEMRRQHLVIVALSILVLVAAPVIAEAQSGTIYRVGWVHLGSETREATSYFESFFEVMSDRGYVAGRNLIVDRRNAEGDMGRCPR